MGPKIVKEGYVVITPTMCQGDVLSWRTEDDEGNEMPDVYTSKENAWKEIAQNLIDGLEQFIAGERELEDTDFSTDDDVVEYKEFSDGRMVVGDDDDPIIKTTISEWRKNL